MTPQSAPAWRDSSHRGPLSAAVLQSRDWISNAFLIERETSYWIYSPQKVDIARSQHVHDANVPQQSMLHGTFRPNLKSSETVQARTM